MNEHELFQSEQMGDAIVVRPMRNMGEFEMASADSAEDTPFEQLVQLTDGHNVVVDLSQTDYFGSSTIGLFNLFVSHVEKQGKKIAFCNLSQHEREVVGITHVNLLWKVKDTLPDALEFVSAPLV